MRKTKKRESLHLFDQVMQFVISFFSEGHDRSIKAKKHILISFVIKGLSILIGFATVPITLGYINKEQYGIWLTLSSVVAWLDYFDIGLGNGLRNKLAESLAVNDSKKSKIYVSSTYGFLGILFSIIMLLLFIASPFLDWYKILNVSANNFKDIHLIATITICFFCISIVLKLIHSIFFADQRPSIPGSINLTSNALSLIIIYILTLTTKKSLLYLALTLGLTPLIILVLTNFIFFNGKYRKIAPSIKYINFNFFHDLIVLGFKFFMVSISGLVIFATDNMIITQIFGPSEVPAYAVSHKYFSLITSVFAIVSVPFWSAYTEAYLKKEFKWIISTNNKLIKIWFLLCLFSLILLVFSDLFYKFWVPELDIPFKLSVLMCIYVNALAFGNIFVYFINGVGKVQLQTVYSIIAAILNIPLSYLLSKTLGLGPSGVIAASIICIGYGPFVAPIQFKKIINNKAKGIWNR